MKSDVLSRDATTLARRVVLEPGEASPWHRDVCRRFTVVVRGDALAIEYRDGDEGERFPVSPGIAGWDEPEPRAHRAVNVGSEAYEEVVLFVLPTPDVEPQPEG